MAIWDIRIRPGLGGGLVGSVTQRTGSDMLGAFGAVLTFLSLVGLPFAVVAGIGRIFIEPSELNESQVQVMSWAGCMLYLIPILVVGVIYLVQGGGEGPLMSFGYLLAAVPGGWIVGFVLSLVLQVAHWPINLIFWGNAPSLMSKEGFSYQAVFTVVFIVWGGAIAVLAIDFLRSTAGAIRDRRR